MYNYRGGSKKMFFDEVSILLRISHPNLVGMMGFFLEEGMSNSLGLNINFA